MRVFAWIWQSWQKTRLVGPDPLWWYIPNLPRKQGFDHRVIDLLSFWHKTNNLLEYNNWNDFSIVFTVAQAPGVSRQEDHGRFLMLGEVKLCHDRHSEGSTSHKSSSYQDCPTYILLGHHTKLFMEYYRKWSKSRMEHAKLEKSFCSKWV